MENQKGHKFLVKYVGHCLNATAKEKNMIVLIHFIPETARSEHVFSGAITPVHYGSVQGNLHC